jgi:DNA-binding response OmpR family regulator
MRVLIVEDDAALGLFLQKGLKLEGHEVTWVGDGEAALVYAAEHRPDLIVLDLSLPKKDGTEVLAEMRGRFDETAVLVLTGRSQVEERVKCLNMGADDCLLKPFSFHELTARCRALLRRREQFADPILRHGDVELNRMERRVLRTPSGRAYGQGVFVAAVPADWRGQLLGRLGWKRRNWEDRGARAERGRDGLRLTGAPRVVWMR